MEDLFDALKIVLPAILLATLASIAFNAHSWAVGYIRQQESMKTYAILMVKIKTLIVSAGSSFWAFAKAGFSSQDDYTSFLIGVVLLTLTGVCVCMIIPEKPAPREMYLIRRRRY